MTRPTSAEIRAAMIAQGAPDAVADRVCGPERSPRAKRAGPTPESQVIHECMAYLKHRTRWCHRMNTGAYKDGARFIRYGFEGCPDIQAQLHDGRILFVECKAPGGRMRPAQERFFDMVRSPHVVAIVARSVGDLQDGGL